VSTDTPVSVVDGEYHAVDPRSIQVQRIGGWIVTAILGALSLAGGGIALASAEDAPDWLRVALPVLWLAAISLLAWHAYRWPPLEYRHTSYRVDGQGIEIRKGVYWRVVIHVPRSRVQHTDVSEGPVERAGHARHLYRRHRPRQG
jgi:membrane protein YdbS with pleckstrin-like domain